ncbi:PTS sugar transporter subunit IIA [Konateibacter massiliensis]|uniref:PTS sugar transporter subunit IIA n=1 Tax=Konateibacter massiliensis TaxID=2002841 RepID=UPI000C160487|nr:PTS glucose transporter subunit IIA [Konateibacter massiliensis]
MLSIFKKKIDKNLYAPVDGKCIDITEVKDNVFATKTMGDGVAIEPSNNVICSPCNGVITMLFPSNHAFGVKMDDGKEVLVHIGIDTVKLNGKGFKAFRKEKDRVKAGDPVIELDKDLLISKGYDVTTILVITDAANDIITKINMNRKVLCNDKIICC